MATFIFKTEPSTYSFADLVREKRAVWDGITNNAALGHLRTAVKGDEVLVYHTGDGKAIVGLARVAGAVREDPKHPGTNTAGAPKFAVVDLVPVRAVPSPVTLAQIRADKRFASLGLVRQSRLSVVPVPPEMDGPLRKLAGL
jgi:predicted RNA-binding protein with PUA-like domain